MARDHHHDEEFHALDLHAAQAPKLAPIERDPDEPRAPKPDAIAHVFPTEADEAEALAQVVAADPELSHANEHVRGRAVRAQLDKNARALKRRRTLVDVVIEEAAPLFPTQSHADDLRDAIPGITDVDVKRVLVAGPDAWAASIEAHEPLTERAHA